MFRSASGKIASAFAILFIGASAWGHIVPPEEFHPMAEAYRRAVFMLNLNPVLWDEVRTDTQTIATHLSGVAPSEGEAYRATMTNLLEMIAAEAAISAPSPVFRKQTAREVFELSTQAVGRAVIRHLEIASENLNDYATAGAAFDAARQIWMAYEFEVEATDPEMFRAIGLAWLSASSAMGYEGIEGTGGTPADREIFESETKTIIDYVRGNFVDEYAAPETGRLVALPVKSPSFVSNAVVPAKLPPGSNLNKQLPRPRQVLNMAERGVDETETTLIALGDMAFDSPYIFGEPARSLQMSCNTCHNKSMTNPQLFIPGLSTVKGGIDVSNAFFAPHANNGHFDPLDSPDLRGIRFTAPYGRNGRFASLREFVRNVIVNEFNGPEPSPVMLDGMIAYMNEFDFLPNPMLKPDGTLRDDAPAATKRGEKLFNKPFEQMAGKSCATCHIPSNHFVDGLRHDIGSVTKSNEYARDGAMDTPTLLSARWSQPYFHDGSLPTLRSVVEWFNENYALELKESETSDLTAYLETVGDGVDAYEDTMYTLEAELEEFRFFLSSYEFMKARGLPELEETLFQTIALEIRAHKWDVQDASQLPVLDRMAALMDDAYMAALADDRESVDRLVSEYRATYEEHAAALK